jgi:transposase-like protein
MSKAQKKRSAEFKLKIAIESLKGDQAITKLASDHELHPRQITRWRDQLLAEGANVFVHKASKKSVSDPEKSELLHIIDQLGIEVEYLKKKLKRLP